MEDRIKQLIEYADNGRKYWNALQLDSKEFVLLLPNDTDEEMAAICREAFSDMLEKEGVAGRVLCVDDGTISQEASGNLIQLYSMYRFTDRLIIGSLDKPYGRKIKNLLSLDNMDLRTAVRAVLFGLEN